MGGQRPASGAEPARIEGMSNAVGAAFVDLGLAAWSVPAAVVGVPGLLVLLVVALQAIGGAAWLPVARRGLRGEGARSTGSRSTR